MRLLSCNALIYSLQVLAAVSLVIPKAAAFAEDQDPLPFNDNQTKGTQVGDVYEVNISSTYDKSDIKPVTSEDGKTDTYTLMYANASYISVHFRQFDLPSSCSLAITTDDNGEEEEQPYTLTGQGKFDLGTFWAHHVNGDTMKLSLSCDEEEDKEFALFEIDQFAAGFPLNNNPEVHPNERHLRSRTKERSFEEEKISSFLKATDPLISYNFPADNTNQFVHGLCAMGASHVQATSTDPNLTYTPISEFQNGVKMWDDRNYVTSNVSGVEMCQGGIYLQPSRHKVSTIF